MTDERIERARDRYDRAVFGGDDSGLATSERELDAVEADLALARGRLLHARVLDGGAEDPRELPLFERALRLYRSVGDPRGEGEASFWVGIVHQVVRHDNDAAVPYYTRARELAGQVGDDLALSYALRHLGVVEHTAGRLDTARDLLEESTRLRRELGFAPGVAANLVGLAYVAIGEGRYDDAVAILDEAAALAEQSDAHGVARSIARARAELGDH